MTEPKTTYLEDEYRFLWEDLDIEITVERLREERGTLRADFSPQSASGAGFLPTQTLDLRSGESAKRYANVLGSRLLDGDQWFELLTKAQRLARDRYQSGEPSIVLKHVDWTGRPRFLVYPLVEAGVRTILFGDGGVSKSLHSLALAVSVATGEAIIPGTTVMDTGPVLYLDWEDEERTHAERLSAICAGVGIEVPDNIIYMRRTGSLHESTREIRREIAKQGAVMAIIDSVGAACGGDPEKASDVIRAFDSMRALGVTVLALHHVTKDQKDKSKPFGSVYSANLARLTWRLDAERGPHETYIRAQSYKGNNNGDLPPLGHRISFEVGEDDRLTAVRFSSASPGRVPSAGGKSGGLKNAIAAALKSGPLTVAEIATEIGSTESTVRTTLNRNEDWFVTLPDGRRALKADEEEERHMYRDTPNNVLSRYNTGGLPIGNPVSPVLRPSDQEEEAGSEVEPW